MLFANSGKNLLPVGRQAFACIFAKLTIKYGL